MTQHLETKGETSPDALTVDQLPRLSSGLSLASIEAARRMLAASIEATPTPSIPATPPGGASPSVVTPLAPTPFRKSGGPEKCA